VNTATLGFRCDYHEGMFANEPLRGDWLDCVFQYEATRFHEAGHAVVGYALGEGIGRIETCKRVVRGEDGALRFWFDGTCYERAGSSREINILIRRRILNERVVSFAVSTAAGPAAERKYNLLRETPLNCLGGAVSDHHALSVLRKELCYRIEPYFDIQEEAWRRAQDALELGVIWNAVEELQGALEESWPDDEPGEYVCATSGSTARAIMRRCGIRPGMLDGMWAPIEGFNLIESAA
jgi:hypothetical protein